MIAARARAPVSAITAASRDEIVPRFSLQVAVRLRLYPLRNSENANLLLHFSSVEIRVRFRVVSNGTLGGGIQKLFR